MSFSVAEMIIYFGGLMGIILSTVSFFASKKSQHIKYSLSALLLVTSLTIVSGSLNFSGKTIHFIHLFRIDSPFHYLLGPVIYFYTLTLLNPNFKYHRIHLLHLLPFLLNSIAFLPFYMTSSEIKMEYYLRFLNKGSVIMPFHYLMKTILFSFYFIAQFFLLKKYHFTKLIKSKNSSYLIYWFIIYMGSQFILIAGVILDHITGLKLFEDPYQFSNMMITFFHLSVVIGLLFFPELLYGTLTTEIITKEKYSFSKLTEKEKSEILNKLYEYIKQEEKPYLNEKISLTEVSKLLEIVPQQLSQVINEKTNYNFNDFINFHRIVESKRLLTSPSFSKLTIDAIAQKAGFNSKSAFYTAFKKHTGMTPKEFIGSNSQDILAPSA
jgi:AraC-like DNA-binding protein